MGWAEVASSLNCVAACSPECAMMVHNRLFLIGLVLLFIGIQLRMVKSFELNEKASQFVE